MDWLSWLGTIKIIVPMVVAKALPNANPILPGLIAHGIEISENAATHKVGKLATAINVVQTSIAGINAVHPNLIDPAQVNAVLSDVISTTVDSTNLIHNVPIHKGQ